MSSLEILGYIYLLQDGKDKGTKIYKIGRSLQKGGDSRKLSRIQAYSPGSVQYGIWKIEDETTLNLIEKKIKDLFKQKYLLVQGAEWFQGDVKQMKKDIDKLVDEFEKNQADVNSTQSACIDDEKEADVDAAHSRIIIPHVKTNIIVDNNGGHISFNEYMKFKYLCSGDCEHCLNTRILYQFCDEDHEYAHTSCQFCYKGNNWGKDMFAFFTN